MKVLKVLTGTEHGGAANSSRLLIDGILNKNEEAIDFSILMLCNGSFAKEIKEKYPEYTTILKMSVPPIIGNANILIKIYNYLRLLWWFFIAFVKFRRYIKNNKVDIIHTTNNYALIVCAIHRVFYPITTVSHWRCIGVKNKLVKLLSTKLDGFICISASVKKSLPYNFQKKSFVIYNGINISELVSLGKKKKGCLRANLKTHQDTILFGTLGTYTDVKCHDLLIECSNLFHKKYPHIDFRCVLIGSTPSDKSKSYLSYLKNKVRMYKLDEYVNFIFDSDLEYPAASYIVDFDFFVGSTWNYGLGEGFGLIYVEAMSQGIPVVAINVGAAGELIEPGTGILSDDNSADEHLQIFERLINQKELKKFNPDFIQGIAYKYDISNTIKNVICLYKNEKNIVHNN